MSPNDVHVTRIRSDLARVALTSDLVLQASADQSELPNMRYRSPTYPPCPQDAGDINGDVNATGNGSARGFARRRKR